MIFMKRQRSLFALSAFTTLLIGAGGASASCVINGATQLQYDSGNGNYACEDIFTKDDPFGMITIPSSGEVSGSPLEVTPNTDGTVSWTYPTPEEIAADFSSYPSRVASLRFFSGRGDACIYGYGVQVTEDTVGPGDQANKDAQLLVCGSNSLAEDPPSKTEVLDTEVTECDTTFAFTGGQNIDFPVAVGIKRNVEGENPKIAICGEQGNPGLLLRKWVLDDLGEPVQVTTSQVSCDGEFEARTPTSEDCAPNSQGEIPLDCAPFEYLTNIELFGPGSGVFRNKCSYYENKVCEDSEFDQPYCVGRTLKRSYKKTFSKGTDVFSVEHFDGSTCSKVIYGKRYYYSC